jgi:hypothetical protein
MNTTQRRRQQVQLPGDMIANVARYAACAADVHAMLLVCREWALALGDKSYLAQGVWVALIQHHFPGYDHVHPAYTARALYMTALWSLARRMGKMSTHCEGSVRWCFEEHGRSSASMDEVSAYPRDWDRESQNRATTLVDVCARFLYAVSPGATFHAFTYNDASDRRESHGYYMNWSRVNKSRHVCWIYCRWTEPSDSGSESD